MKLVRDKGVPSSYHHGKAVSSLVDDCQTVHPPLAVWLEVLHLFRCFTHTHIPGRGRAYPEKAKGKKQTVTRWAKREDGAGGRKKRISRTTNLHGETDLPRTEHAQKIIGTNEEKIQFVFSSNMQDRALLS